MDVEPRVLPGENSLETLIIITNDFEKGGKSIIFKDIFQLSRTMLWPAGRIAAIFLILDSDQRAGISFFPEGEHKLRA